MPRYHITKAGNPGVCRAKIKCPLGDLTTEHYDSKDEAREAYENSKKTEVVQSHKKLKNKDPYAMPRELTKLLFDSLHQETSDKALKEQIEYFDKRIDEPVSELDFLKMEAIEAEEARELARRGEIDKAAAKEIVLGLMTPLIDHYRIIYDRKKQYQMLEAELVYQQSLDDPESIEFFESKKDVKRIMKSIENLSDDVKRTEIITILQNFKEQSIPILEEKKTKFKIDYENNNVKNVENVENVRREMISTPLGEKTVSEIILDHSPEYFEGGDNSSYAAAAQKIQETSDDLIERLSEKGKFNLPDDSGNHFDNPSALPLSLRSNPDFSLIGSGVESNVYLHKPTQMVYKIAHKNNDYIRNKSDDSPVISDLQAYRELHRENQEAYLEIQSELISEKGISYIPTLFLTSKDSEGREIPIVAQPYLDSKDWAPIDLSLVDDLYEANLNDLHDGNVKVNKKDGRIVIFDGVIVDL